MKPRHISDRILSVGAVDWDRRLFDSLIPLPDGTSYNAYLVKGSEKTALLDTVDPTMAPVLFAQLEDVGRIDYVVSHHVEQDHSGTIPLILEKYPEASIICTRKAKSMLIEHLCINDERIITVEDRQAISLGDRTLLFIHTPWVHWPETMCSFIPEERVLFSCDFFGSHLATTDLFVTDKARVYEAAKRYYAEIMMPFRATILGNVAKIESLSPAMIAPSHGPIYGDPSFIIDAYKDWASDSPRNLVVVPYISMHGSTKAMVERLVAALARREVSVQQVELSGSDIGKLAIWLVDAATVVWGTPTVHVGPHPLVAYAAILADALRPKVKYASVVGSYGWATKAVEAIAALTTHLKVEMLEPVLCKGFPREGDFERIEKLAETIAEKHRTAGFRGV